MRDHTIEIEEIEVSIYFKRVTILIFIFSDQILFFCSDDNRASGGGRDYDRREGGGRDRQRDGDRRAITRDNRPEARRSGNERGSENRREKSPPPLKKFEEAKAPVSLKGRTTV